MSLRVPAALVGLLVLGGLTGLEPPASAQAGAAQAGAAQAGAAPERISSRFEPGGTVGVGETVRLSIEVQGADLGTPPRLELENLRIVGGPSHSTSLSFVNGRTARSVAYIWAVQPLEVGEAALRGGSLDLDGEAVAIPSATLEVVAEAPIRQRRRPTDPFERLFGRSRRRAPDPFPDRRVRPQREPQAPEIFLRTEITPRTPYVGQQVLYTLYLYTDVNIRSVTPNQLPDFQGFWTETIELDPQGTPERVEHDGRIMGRLPLIRRALFPRRAGTIEIEPVSATLTALIEGRSVFDSILPRQQQVDRSTEPVQLEVRALPEPAPEGFGGAVGSLRLETRLEPRTLAVGEATTLTLTLSGRGHLAGVAAPKIDLGPDADDLDIFDPQQQSRDAMRGDFLHGRREWSYVLIPRRAGRLDLPAIRIPYFDPNRGEYAVATSDDLSLDVTGATRLARDDGGAAQLHGVRMAAPPSLGASSDAPHPLGGRGVVAFWLPLGLALLALAVAWRRPGIASSARVPAARETPAGAAAAGTLGGSPAGSGPRVGTRQARRDLLAALGEAQTEETPRASAARAETAWREYLAARFDLPLGAPPRAWAAHLESRGAAADAVAELVRLVDDLHYLRYAPILSSTDGLRDDVFARSKRLVKRL